MPAPSMPARDAVSGGVVTASHDGHHVVITDDGVDVLHLTPASALLLAQQILAAVTPAGDQ